LLLLLSPLFAYLSWRIRQDGGSAVYAHTRVGRGGELFQCLKFRSMIPDAEAVLQDLLARDSVASAEWGRDFKLKSDPRITSIGEFLRKSSLDELPQLWNVLKGDMSLVGPRPVVEAELERYGDLVDYYLEARPGITGLWQISGRSNIEYSDRVNLDAWYVQNWSLWYDLVILLKTVRVVVRCEGAY
jgi:Undecaprenyl-phosphate galactose phosphotransferase WbaP